MAPPFEVSREPPLFFLSYAHSAYGQGRNGGRREPNPHVLRLFEDLSMHVSEMVPTGSGGDPGFVDRSMGGGERWSPELLTAVGTCQVFVALVSQPYVSRPWCAKEWDAFSRRPVVRTVSEAPLNGTALLPVVWTPPTASMPTTVSDVQLFTPHYLHDTGIATQYHREGIYGLLHTSSKDAYTAVVWRLAQRIVEILGQFHVEPRIPASPDELANVFADGAERNG